MLVRASPEQDTSLCLVLVQPRKTRPNMTEKMLTGTSRIKSNKQSNSFNLRKKFLSYPGVTGMTCDLNNRKQIVLCCCLCLICTSGPEVIKLFSCSTQLSMKFQLLIRLKYQQIKKFLALSLSDVVFIMLINVKMPTSVAILTFMSRINFVLS